ncbi:MAG TPA: hypothetical protein PLO62_04755 [Candidatus Hydrogenedentes bacterium]|nr:hypothetical protein [Candidatus Hydrogenedentota bacterium]HOS03175.1 hypothetical protein [Candidatus Hydrogenedentota bacterium]
MDMQEHAIEFNIVYHINPYPAALRKDLDEIAQVCDGVYIPVTEAMLLEAPNVIRRAVDFAQEVDLVVMFALSGFGNILGGGRHASIFTASHPEYNCITSNGRAIPMSCPNKPAVRSYFQWVVEDLMTKYGPAGLLAYLPSWSLPSHFGSLEPGETPCRCADCKAAYRGWASGDMPDHDTPETASFRAQTMAALLDCFSSAIKSRGDHLIASVCLAPNDSLEFKKALASVRDLDAFGVTAYWRPNSDITQREYISRHVGEAVGIARESGKLAEAWICAFDQDARHESDAAHAARLCADMDVDILSTWSYRDYQSGAPLDKPSAGDPELVWQNLRRAYHELREGKEEEA